MSVEGDVGKQGWCFMCFYTCLFNCDYNCSCEKALVARHQPSLKEALAR